MDLNKINSIELVKFVNSDPFYFYSFLLTILSFAGMPPLSGFLIKIIQFFFFIINTHIILLIIFILFNILTMYFYYLNIKYLISFRQKNINNSFNFSKKNKKFHFIIILLNLVNIFSIIFVSNFIQFFLVFVI